MVLEKLTLVAALQLVVAIPSNITYYSDQDVRSEKCSRKVQLFFKVQKNRHRVDD